MGICPYDRDACSRDSRLYVHSAVRLLKVRLGEEYAVVWVAHAERVDGVEDALEGEAEDAGLELLLVCAGIDGEGYAAAGILRVGEVVREAALFLVGTIRLELHGVHDADRVHLRVPDVIDAGDREEEGVAEVYVRF